MPQTLLWSRMICSLKFINIPQQFWLKLLLHTFWCIAMHLQRLSLLFIASSSRKKYWNWTPPWIKAQIELSSTFAYDYEMSTGGRSARISHLAQGERTKMKPMPANRSFYCREPLKEGVTKIFRVIYLCTGSIFCDNKFGFALSHNSVHRHEHHCRSSPPRWGANSSQNCRPTSFCSRKQRC